MGNRFLVIVMVVTLLTVESSGTQAVENGKRVLCSNCYPAIRKMLKRSTGVKSKDEETVAGSLRTAPSGPNPLHHNGSPINSQTP